MVQLENIDQEDSKQFDISKIDFDKLRKEFEKHPKKKTLTQELKIVIEKRLLKLLQRNPMRADFQKHYEEIIEAYNREKDRLTIEQTFENLLKIMNMLDEEEKRCIREGLDEESLVIFDLLRKPELSQNEIKKIKKVAVELLETLKKEKLKIDRWREKESTRDAVKNTIRNFLYDDSTGLPVDFYSVDEVNILTEEVFKHIYRVYPEIPSPYYGNAS